MTTEHLNPAKSSPEKKLQWSFDSSGNDLVLRLNGSLNNRTVGKLWQNMDNKLKGISGNNLTIDAHNLDYIDISGQAFLLQSIRSVQAEGGQAEIIGLRSDFEALHHQLSCFDCQDKPEPAKKSIFEEMGRATHKLGLDIKAFFIFLGQFVSAFAYCAVKPHTIRWKDVMVHIENVGARAVFIIVLIGFLMGLIISFQSAMPLRMFGAEIFVARLLGLSMVRELGPLVTAIILAGRTGSSFAAEIGTMKINEEINALTTMGLSPIKFLVVPRMLATMIIMPFLTMFFILFSLIGGAIVMLSLGFPLITYINQITMSLTMADFAGGMFKAVVFSLLVAWIGCVRGLQTTTGAKAVGLSTTSAVVSGIVLIAVADGIFAVVFFLLGI
ncbi:ABC transporter permease [Desulfonatronovibrio magnus]|uniref:ABC transporter permease n=1 Tax=Desulfonatronovibrio magnus TaxID=698827 RepID=UPI0005EBC73E|nr:MlaE family lipid ABC transporter permease subunit [Desulfonatronovibrio magnus]